MFVQSKAVTSARHKDGLALKQRCGGNETLVQWSNGTQHWCQTNDLEYQGASITLVAPATSEESTDG